MKTIFLLNPKAGDGKGLDKIREQVNKTAKELGVEAGVYQTKSKGDGEKFARLAAKEAVKNNEQVRIVACGGDGTLNEVLNGIMGYDCAAVGIIPIGTGNDFARNFADAGDFMNIEAQLKGEVRSCDVIKYSGLINGVEQTRYCANMFNIGFDCNVVDLTAQLKKYPLLKGSMAYIVAVLGILIKKKGAKLKIEIDGEVVEDGPVLLTAVANGSFCGGGMKSSPHASVNDGLMDTNIIYNVTRREFLQKFPHYTKGTHLELPDIGKILFYKQCKKVVITPLGGNMRLCTDGEITDAGEVTMEVVPEAASILIPKA